MLECADYAKIKRLQQVMVDYWVENGRRNLPWRLTRNPWHILLAEVLLRKTTSQQALIVYNDLSKLSINEVKDMSIVELEDVLKPLGIYRVRARQIHTLAGILSSLDYESWQKSDILDHLPSVGPYARNALLCFAFGFPRPALDTNMIRLISRVFGIRSNRSRAREDKELWKFAELLVPPNECREFNWGVLDFANAVCTAKNPKHGLCPITTVCEFYKGSQECRTSQVEND